MMLNANDVISVLIIIISGLSLRKAHIIYHTRIQKKGFYSPFEWKNFNSKEKRFLLIFLLGIILLFILESIKA